MIKLKVFLLSLIILPVIISAQEIKPRVAVFPMDGSGDYQLEIVSDRITSTAGLVLKMLNKYEISESPEILPSDIASYCRSNSIDNVITGKSEYKDNDTITVSMSVYNREEGRVTLSASEDAESVFDIFDAAEKAVYILLEGFSGEHIAFGSIVFNNSGVEGDYSVLIDGNEYQHVAGRLDKVLNGERVIKVHQNRMLSPYTIAEGSLTVSEGKEAVFDISIPGFLEDELALIEKQEKVINKYWEKRTKADKVEKAFSELGTALEVTDYSTAADEKMDEILLRKKDWDKQKLILAEGDGRRELLIGLRARALVYSQLNDTFDLKKATFENGGDSGTIYNSDLQFCEFPSIPQPCVFIMYQFGMTNFLDINGPDPGDAYDFMYNMYTFSFAYAYNFGGDGLRSKKN